MNGEAVRPCDAKLFSSHRPHPLTVHLNNGGGLAAAAIVLRRTSKPCRKRSKPARDGKIL
jgi:hypothetical protein